MTRGAVAGYVTVVTKILSYIFEVCGVVCLSLKNFHTPT